MNYFSIVAIALAVVATNAEATTDALTGEACPLSSAQVVEGDACLPFLQGSCPFGEVCCGDECFEERFCTCDEDSLSLKCWPNEIYCPSACPAIKPEEGELCAISELFVCSYGSGTCLNYYNQTIDYDITCTCQSGAFTCEQGCPSYGSGPTRPSSGTNNSGAGNDTTNVVEKGGKKEKKTKVKKENKKTKTKRNKSTRRLGATRNPAMSQ
jgi:hypothetical protein